MEFSESTDIFDGVFRHFQNETSTSRNVQVKTSSCFEGRYPMKIFLKNSDSSFLTKTSTDTKQWLSFELKHHILSITSYSIKTPDHNKNEYPHLKSWRFLGSIDKAKWDVLDEQTNTDVLNIYATTRNFNCSLNYKGLYRFFKIQQTGLGFSNEYGFGINLFELFGTLYKVNHVPVFNNCTCKRKTVSLLWMMLFVIVS